VKRICIGFFAFVLTAPLTGRAGQEAPVAARHLLLGGKYAEAAEIYARSAKENPASALGLARCLTAEGRLDEAVRKLAYAAGDHAELHAELARLAFERGNYKVAKTHADEAIRLDPHQLQARWVRAELLRTSGRLDESAEVYRWLVTYYNRHDVKKAEPLCWIGLAAAQHARWNRLADQFTFLVNDLYPDALKAEPGYWPAHYQAGLLFLEKYNQAEAARQLKAALALNPNAAEVHAALAKLALIGRELPQAQASVERALQINPRLLDAWLVKADLAWANFKPLEAIRLLQKKALPLNPTSEETLGRLAACYVLLHGPPEKKHDSRFARLVDQVTSRNKHAGKFFFALAKWLETRNKVPEAEQFFREAVARMPQQLGPRSHLGLLYMRSAQEDKARKILTGAFKVDPFNVRVNNTLGLFEVLDSMETLETQHFAIKYDGSRDRLLARYAAGHLETVFPELCERFGYEPPGKSLFEIFNRARGLGGQKWFSTRMIGLPYLGTVAASTGMMVAMTSPNDPTGAKKFNWARVLTHELVHVITLQQTDFNIPHWYTEALAVHSEGYPRPPAWNKLLRRRVPKGKLFNLDTINFGFTRPQSGDDCHMAYCQAELYLEYMLKRFGNEAEAKLLAAYADNLTTSRAIRRALGVAQEDFERGYVEYLKKTVAELAGLDPREPLAFAELLKAHRARPDDVDAAADLAYAYLLRKAYKEAEQLAERVLSLHPKHQLATYVLARLRLRDDRRQEAVDMIESCLSRQSPQPKALNLLAGLKLKAEKYDEAARLYALGQRRDPLNIKWTRQLARVYLLSENRDKLRKALTQIARVDADDLTIRKKLARLALSDRDYDAAARWAQAALEIDVADAEVHRAFAEALVGCNNNVRAIEEFETAIELDPSEPHQRFALADACLQAGKTQKARHVLRSLLKLVPDYPAAAMLLENIEESDKP